MRTLYSPGAILTAFFCMFQYVANAQNYDGKAMRSWWLAGPDLIGRNTAKAPDMGTMEKFFNDTINDIKLVRGRPEGNLSVHSKKLTWFQHNSKGDIIDFDSIFKRADYATAY